MGVRNLIKSMPSLFLAFMAFLALVSAFPSQLSEVSTTVAARVPCTTDGIFNDPNGTMYSTVKRVNGSMVCAETCISAKGVGLCPRPLYILGASLKQGSCSAQGYSVLIDEKQPLPFWSPLREWRPTPCSLTQQFYHVYKSSTVSAL